MPWLRRKLARKLGVGFCLAAGLALALADFLILRDLQSHLLDELKTNLHNQARQLALTLPPDVLVRTDPSRQGQFVALQKATGVRYTLIRAEGTVLADSQVAWEDLPQVENHGTRPEVVLARQAGEGSDIRRSQTIGADFLYVAVAVGTSDRPAFVRLALPLTDVQSKFARFRKLVLGATLAAVLAGLAIIAGLSGWITRPLSGITRAVESMADGRMDVRAPVQTDDEVGRLSQAFNAMAARLAATLDQLKAEKEEVAAILNGMVEQVVAVDAAGRIRFLNPEAEALFGIESGAAAGKNFIECIRQRPVHDLLRKVLAERREIAQEFVLLLPEERIFEARAAVIAGEAGPGALLVMHDITRLRRLEEVRREFVANVSHELRTPLTSIQGFAETLLAGALGDREHNREFVQTIYDQAENLGRLVNDLLDLAAMESGRKLPRLEPVRLAELLQEVERALRPAARKDGIQIELRMPPDLPPVQADRSQLKQLLTNLMDNAIKFNKKDGRVTVSAARGDRTVTVEVEDTGVGIPDNDLPRIFERFYRVDKARSREPGGTGLGLAIVKHIAETHGGSVRARSSLGEGSRFSVTLPLPA